MMREWTFLTKFFSILERGVRPSLLSSIDALVTKRAHYGFKHFKVIFVVIVIILAIFSFFWTSMGFLIYISFPLLVKLLGLLFVQFFLIKLALLFTYYKLKQLPDVIHNALIYFTDILYRFLFLVLT